MDFMKKIILKYKWKLFWIFRRISSANKHLNNVNLVHRTSFVDIINKLEVEKILEIGCGNGANIWLLQEILNNTNLSFYGIDISSAAIEVAQNRLYKYPSNVYFEKDDCISFLFNSTSNFDLILADAVLMYLSYSEVLTILKKISKCSNFLILHELSSNSSESIINTNGFIHNYDKIFEEFPDALVVKSKSLRIENIWGKYGYTFFVRFS
jgi:2-polyprenyl-3-methyl-5-hydroxy-6-metoxy-1,4-benzoquinol methylase